MKKISLFTLGGIIGSLFLITSLKGEINSQTTIKNANSIVNVNDYVEYSYTGDYQEFVVPKSGIYKLEAWGAAGGLPERYNSHTNKATSYGFGGYTSGEIKLLKGQTIYVYVGEEGKLQETKKSFNGGGSSSSYYYATSGGGATDFRLSAGNWEDTNSLRSRIMVAAGGGGVPDDNYCRFGESSSGGGLIGYKGSNFQHAPLILGNGGTQTKGGHTSAGPSFSKGGLFGIGESAPVANSCGGGGGWYGGSAGAPYTGGTGCAGGGGGSSYISGHLGCVGITEDGKHHATAPIGSKIVYSYHYSNLIFENTYMVDGDDCIWGIKRLENQYDHNILKRGETTKQRSGFAKITLLEKSYDITVMANDVAIDPVFDKTTGEYTVNVPCDTTKVSFGFETDEACYEAKEGSVKVFDSSPTLIEDFSHDFTIINSEDADNTLEETFRYNVKRDKSNTQLKSLTLEALGGNTKGYLTEEFDKNKTAYTFLYPENTNHVHFDSKILCPNSTFEYWVGNTRLQTGSVDITEDNTLTDITLLIKTQSEDNNLGTYTITIRREKNKDDTLKELLAYDTNEKASSYEVNKLDDSNYQVIIPKTSTTAYLELTKNSRYSFIEAEGITKEQGKTDYILSFNDLVNETTKTVIITSEYDSINSTGISKTINIHFIHIKDTELGINGLTFDCDVKGHNTHEATAHSLRPTYYVFMNNGKEAQLDTNTTKVTLNIKLINKYQKVKYGDNYLINESSEELLFKTSEIAINTGSNYIEFIVEAEDGNTQSYTLFIVRASEDYLYSFTFSYINDTEIVSVADVETLKNFNYILPTDKYLSSDVEEIKLKAVLNLQGDYSKGEWYRVGVSYNEDEVSWSEKKYFTEDNLSTIEEIINVKEGAFKVFLQYDYDVEQREDVVKYTFGLYKKYSDASLALSYQNQDLVFKDNINTFTLYLPNGVDNINVDYLINNKATITSEDLTVTTDTKKLSDISLSSDNIKTYTVIVQAEDINIEATTYTLRVLREKDLYINQLKISGGVSFEQTLSFTNGKLLYDAVLPYNVNSIVINNIQFNHSDIAMIKSPESSSDNEYTFDLKTGLNNITLVVGLKNDTGYELFDLTYTINITRLKNDQNDILSFKYKDSTINPIALIYLINVGSDVTKINSNDFKLEVSENATYTIQLLNANEYLNYGQNHFYVEVRAENGDLNIQKGLIYRAYDFELISSPDGTLDKAFNVLETQYTLSIPKNKASFRVDAVLPKLSESQLAVLDVRGAGVYSSDVECVEITLLNKNSYVSKEKTYRINIVVEKDSNSNLENIEVLDFTLNPSFVGTTYEYISRVNMETTKVDILVTKANELQDIYYTDDLNNAIYSKLEGNTISISNLVDGANKLYIKVISEADTNSVYLVNIIKPYDDGTPWQIIKKEEASIDLSNPLFLSNLKPNATFSDLKAMLENKPEYLELVDKDGVLSDDTIVKTGMILKYVVDGVLRDIRTINVFELDETFKLQSDEYEVKEASILGALKSTSVNEFKAHFKYSEYIVIYTSDNQVYTGTNVDDKLVVKLVFENKVYDAKVIVIPKSTLSITSNKYTINANTITNVASNTSASKFVSNLENGEYIKIYEKDGITLYEGNEVKDGFVVKLERDGEVYDSKTIVIESAHEVESNSFNTISIILLVLAGLFFIAIIILLYLLFIKKG